MLGWVIKNYSSNSINRHTSNLWVLLCVLTSVPVWRILSELFLPLDPKSMTYRVICANQRENKIYLFHTLYLRDVMHEHPFDSAFQSDSARIATPTAAF